jgi:glycosyltransferase involved in cell wall biosynthesis
MERVAVCGRVPDVTPYLDAATVVAAPLRQGGGMRVKVLEALAAGKAVVATPLAVEGLDLAPGREALVAHDAAAFADAVALLVQEPARRARIAGTARAWAAAHLGWERSAAAYEALYDHLPGADAGANAGAAGDGES